MKYKHYICNQKKIILNLNVNTEIENKFKRFAKNYKGDYNNMFTDIFNYYIKELKKGIQNIELDLNYFEKKYSMTTKEFYEKFQKGELGDENNDYFQWSGEYEIWLDHKKDLK